MAEASEPKIPYKPGTKKFLVAQKVLAGETDAEKIAREVGCKKDTVYVVRSELRKNMPKQLENPQSLDKSFQEDVSEKASGSLPDDVKGRELTSEIARGIVDEVTKTFKDELRRLMEGSSQKLTADEKLPRTPLEAEDVEVVGEKVNYKVALNPEIFWRYNVFKAEAERRGKKWNGSFSDFLDMATKDILAVYGIHPTVVAMKGKKLLVELPVNMEETASS